VSRATPALFVMTTKISCTTTRRRTFENIPHTKKSRHASIIRSRNGPRKGHPGPYCQRLSPLVHAKLANINHKGCANQQQP
jgi:hypothetical protein